MPNESKTCQQLVYQVWHGLQIHYLVFRLRRQAYLCVVAKNCTEAAYLRLVEALCNEHQISLLKVCGLLLTLIV